MPADRLLACNRVYEQQYGFQFFTVYDYNRIRFASYIFCVHAQIYPKFNFCLFSFINMSTVPVNNITWNSGVVERLLDAMISTGAHLNAKKWKEAA